MADDGAQAALEMQTVQRRLQQLDRNLARLEQSMQELTTAIATLEGVSGDDVLAAQVPVGAGVRIPAQVGPAGKVLMDLGSGYSTELSIADAIERLRDRQRDTESAFRTTSEEADRTAQRLQDLQMQAAASSDPSS